MNINPAHLHLLVNDAPMYGVMFAIPLLVTGSFLRTKGPWLAAATLVLVLAGLGGAAAYFTGAGAVEVVEGMPRVSGYALGKHHDRAVWAAVITGVAALSSVVTLAMSRRRPSTFTFFVLPLTLCLAAAGTLAWTSSPGGRINHPELQGPEDLQPSSHGHGEHGH